MPKPNGVCGCMIANYALYQCQDYHCDCGDMVVKGYKNVENAE